MNMTHLKPVKFWRRLIINVICYALALVFFYAAASKLLEYDKFVVTMGQSAMLSPYANILAWLVPMIETCLTVLLVFEWLRLAGLYGSLALMTMFTTYIYIIQRYAETIPCSCGGLLEKMDWEAHFVVNIFLVILNIIGIALQDIQLRNESGGCPKSRINPE